MIKKLTLQEAPAVRDFMQDWTADDRSLGFLWTPEEVTTELHHGFAWSAVFNEKIICLLCARASGDAVELIFLATAPGFRQQGLAKKVFAAAQQERADLPWWLEVHQQNEPARSLYLSLGFREDGRRRRYYRDGGDAILMSLDPTR